MRKNIILMLSLLATVGCTEREFDNTPLRQRIEMTVAATKAHAVADDTRIEFNGSVYDMRWEADDQIGVYIASTGEKANFGVKELGDERKSARFRGEIYEPEATDDYYAFYPATTPFNGSIASFVLPNETSGATTPMLVASCEGASRHEVSFTFKPMTALLELTLGFDADKVVVESNNGESLAGVYAYNFGSNTMQQPMGSTSVTLTSATKGVHYLYMPEITLANGYKVIVEKGGQQMIKSVGYGKEKRFVAGEVTTLAIPSFEAVTVSCNAYTSYTLYKRGDSAANSKDAGTIYFDGGCSYAGISSTLVKECGVYDGSAKVVATANGKSFKIDNRTGLGQGSYQVYAYIKTVDGTEYRSATQTLHITGLPYSINCKDVSINSAAGWSKTGTVSDYYGWQFAYWYIVGSDTKFGELYSPTFYAPENINIKYTASVCYYTSGLGGNSKKLYSGVTTGTTPAKTFSDTMSRKTSNWTPGDSSFTDYPHTTTLPAGNQHRIYIADEHSKSGNVAWNGISMRAFTMHYAF
ncbi:MAG: fimbrillin family protein [Alistipes sp.]|nr:fimbrillin family protein [Alistipes sp.]